jgi:aminomethyltransferase
MLKRTPLYSAHQKLGGKLIEFGGWEMPVQYTGIVDEHLAVRTAAGLFDISHMGEVVVAGPGAAEFLNGALTNDVRKLAPGQGQYTLMCNARGGVIDDLYAYRLDAAGYLLIVNASRIEADVAWLEQLAAAFKGTPVTLRNASNAFGAVAVQGPLARRFIDDVFPPVQGQHGSARPARSLEKNEIIRWRGVLPGESGPPGDAWIACTGYTGEDGFEIITAAGRIELVWNRLLEAGSPHGIKPAGLGARDTLRTEVCYPLYGHELDEATTPIEAGLGFFIALDKGEFMGRSVLAEQKAGGAPRKSVAFKMTGRSAPPRPHYPVWVNGAAVGQVTSGTQSPSLGTGIGLAMLPAGMAAPDSAIAVEIRGKLAPAVIVRKPFYRRA